MLTNINQINYLISYDDKEHSTVITVGLLVYTIDSVWYHVDRTIKNYHNKELAQCIITIYQTISVTKDIERLVTNKVKTNLPLNTKVNIIIKDLYSWW